MDSQTIKWLVFNGKAENYPAWSTKFTAYMQTKGLYKELLGKEIIPEEIAPLAEDASNEQKTARDAKVRERNMQIEEIKERNNTVWCHIALALDNNSLLYIRHDCLSSDYLSWGRSESVASITTKIFKRREANRSKSSSSNFPFTVR